MKKIKIFLASSINDLYAERQEISNFICRTLKKAFGNSVEFELEMCEDDMGMVTKTRKQDLYNQYIRESDYLYILFWHDAGEFTVEEFHAAYEHFEKTDKPHIIPFVKILSEGDKGTEALETFIRYMREEQQHYYVEFLHVDTVKLRILLALAQDPELHMNVELKDAQVLVNNQELTDEQDRAAISVDNIPFYRNHEGINRLRSEIVELEGLQSAARLVAVLCPDDQGAWDEVYAISAKLNRLQEALHQYEMQLLETSMRLTKLTADASYVTPRTKQAIELFEAGKHKEALTVLDMDAFEADLRRAEETAAQSREQMEALVKELTTRVDILMSQGITKETAAEIKELYEKARTITLAHRLGLDCVHNYMNFLHGQNDYTRALQVGDQLYHEYKSRGDTEESDWAGFCNNLAILYADTQRIAEAEKLYVEALEIRRRLAAANPASYELDVATTCNYLAILYKKNKRPVEAEMLYDEALWIYCRLATANPASYEMYVATTCNDLALLYENTQRLAEAEKMYIEALKIYRRLAAANPESYEPDEATTCIGLALLYADNHCPAEAEMLYAEALKIYRRLAAANPASYEPDVAMTCNNLAMLLEDTRRTAEAEKLYAEALEIYRRLAAANPASYEPEEATTCNNLAVLHQKTQRPAEAEKLYTEALEIYRRLAAANPEPYEPILAMTCNNLANLYENTQRLAEAEKLYTEALEIRRRMAAAYPASYEPDVATTCNKLAILYKKNQRPVEAEQLYAEALEIYRRLAAFNPAAYEPDVAKTCYNFALLYGNNDPEKAEALREEAFRIARKYRRINNVCSTIYDSLKSHFE